jgi:sigma-70-like protein
MEARVALTLRTLGRLTTREIARAFLLPETTLAQRLVRARKRLPGPLMYATGAPSGDVVFSTSQGASITCNSGTVGGS